MNLSDINNMQSLIEKEPLDVVHEVIRSALTLYAERLAADRRYLALLQVRRFTADVIEPFGMELEVQRCTSMK